MQYEAKGRVRGTCGHKHRTIKGAFECIAKDQRGCYRRSGYSDRTIQRLDGEPLSDSERCEVEFLQWVRE